MYVSNILFSYDQVFDDSFFNSGIFNGRPVLVKTNGTGSSDALANNSDFQTQTENIDKINSVSEAPGAGIANILGVLTTSNTSESVTLANVEASVQLKDQLKGATNTPASPPSPSNPIENIQSAAVSAINSQDFPPSSLTADQKQLVLISNIKANEIAETSQQRSI